MSLNLDELKSISNIDSSFSAKTICSTIYNLIALVKKFGKYIGIVQRDTTIEQYNIIITYLKFELSVIFELDNTSQFIDIVIYNDDQVKTFLRLSLKINDEPTIKYIENDHSGKIPNILYENIKLKPGEYLINFAHCLLSFIGIDRVRLDDDSLLILNKNNTQYKIKLWLYHLLTKGHSWYSKFGYTPSNSYINELEMALDNVKKINLKEIVNILNKIIYHISDPNKSEIDKNLIYISKEIIQIIGSFTDTLECFTKTFPIESFSILTNNLTQSVFAKTIIIGSNSELIDFSWYKTIRQLFIHNVCQVNNNIKCYFLSLKN